MQYIGQHEHIGGGYIRFIHRWLPDRCDAWASVAIIHGLGDHGGRFDRMARWLIRHGVAVTAIDLIGHGRSSGRRGCYVEYDRLLEELHYFVRRIHSQWCDLPLFVYGQSMGGNLVLNWALQTPSTLFGVIAGAPMLVSHSAPSEAFMRVGRKLGQWIPHWRLRASVDVESLTRDEESQQAYREDRLIHHRVSLGLGLALVDRGQWAIQHASRLNTPALLIHGTEDSLTSHQASQVFSEENPQYVELRLWPGVRHDLHCEPEWKLILDDLRRWMASQVASRDRRLAA